MRILALENVTFAYGKHEILKDQSIYLESGETLLIKGESGCGKSTIINLIIGYIKPKMGSVRVFSKNLRNLGDYGISQIRRSIGVITQFNNLLKDISVLENVMMPMLIAGSDEQDARYQATQILHEVGLGGYEHRSIFELSGGEQKRVAVARALVRKPKLIVADESTSNLDTANADNILNMCMEMVLKNRAALVWTTHESRSEHLFDRKLHLAKI